MSKPIDFDQCGNIAAWCPGCKRVVYIIVNHPSVIEDQNRKEIVDMVVRGYRVESISTAQNRQEPFGCECPKASPSLEPQMNTDKKI